MTRANKAFSRIQKSVDMVRYFGKTSAPYLSQDSFKRIADLDFDTKRPISAKEVDSARVIFCNSGNVENFLELYGKKIRAKVLIFGNNDVDFEDFPHRVPSSVKRVYLQNSSISDGFYKTLPIGVENLGYFQNGLPRLLREEYATKAKNGRALVGPFSSTHKDRASLMSIATSQLEGVDFLKERTTPNHYANLASFYSFVYCPRGNGLDTHRFWETLYRGSIPVVIRSKWSDSIADLGIPIRRVDDWSGTSSNLGSEGLGKQIFDPKSIPALWEYYWISEIRAVL